MRSHWNVSFQSGYFSWSLAAWFTTRTECGFDIRTYNALGAEGFVDPMFASTTAGKCLAILFGFILGYGATLAEPALNALGSTVEKITVGAFKKSLLMQAVALGVALGIGTGVAKIAFNLELWYLLLPPIPYS